MTFTPQFTKLVVTGALLSAAVIGNAHATSVQVSEVALGAGTHSGGLVLPVQSSAANFWTGFQEIKVTSGAGSNSFQAFCIDPFQWSSHTPTTYDKTTLSPTFSAAKVTSITKLFNFGYAGAVGNNLNAAAMQLALWEVANDDGNLLTGAVHKTASTNAALLTQTNFLLSNYAAASATSLYNFTFYKSSGQQDFVTVSAVPEPETYAMLLAGLGIMGTVVRRRKSKQA